MAILKRDWSVALCQIFYMAMGIPRLSHEEGPISKTQKAYSVFCILSQFLALLFYIFSTLFDNFSNLLAFHWYLYSAIMVRLQNTVMVIVYIFYHKRFTNLLEQQKS